MLTPSERNGAINLLVETLLQNVDYGNHSAPYVYAGDAFSIDQALRNGFSGFASFSDRQLVRTLNSYKGRNPRIKEYLDNVLDDIIFGDKNG